METVKLIHPMFAEIDKLLSMKDVAVEGLEHIPATNSITKAERKIQLKFDAVLNREIHETVKEPWLGRFLIHSGNYTFEVDANQAYFEGYDFMTSESQTFTMSISALKDTNEDEGFMRMVIPVSRNYWVHNLRTYSVKTEKTISGGLLILKFPDGIVHVFSVTEPQSKQQYMIVEPQFRVTRDKLFNIHYAVSVGLGLITGTAYFGEAFVLSSEDLEFKEFKSISYYSLRESVRSQYTIFTTNIYWLEMVLKQGKYNSYALEALYNETGGINRGMVDWLYEDVYGQIILNMYLYPEFARAAIILLDGTDKALDYQAAMYAVALETLCTKLKKIYKMDFDGIITEKGTWTRIRKKVTKEFKTSCENYGVENAIIKRISDRIPKLNDISNTDKFNMVLNRLGLTRLESDNEAIRQRNNLLHGELVEKTAEDSSDFDDMYYYSIVLHRLCSAIIFKYAGYNGLLVNNAVLMDRKPACDKREPVLVAL